MGIGAQFGGKYFCHDVRVIRLPRHGASLPIGLGVSCSADRQIKGRIDADGLWLEKLETDPSKYSAGGLVRDRRGDGHRPRPADGRDPRQADDAGRIAAPVLLSGTMIVARDIVHAELSKRLAAGEPAAEII